MSLMLSVAGGVVLGGIILFVLYDLSKSEDGAKFAGGAVAVSVLLALLWGATRLIGFDLSRLEWGAALMFSILGVAGLVEFNEHLEVKQRNERERLDRERDQAKRR